MISPDNLLGCTPRAKAAFHLNFIVRIPARHHELSHTLPVRPPRKPSRFISRGLMPAYIGGRLGAGCDARQLLASQLEDALMMPMQANVQARRHYGQEMQTRAIFRPPRAALLIAQHTRTLAYYKASSSPDAHQILACARQTLMPITLRWPAGLAAGLHDDAGPPHRYTSGNIAGMPYSHVHLNSGHSL